MSLESLDEFQGKQKLKKENFHIFAFEFLLSKMASEVFWVFGALCPSKSGLMNKHIVKHIVAYA